MIRAYWCLSPNYGDALTPLALNYIYQKPVAWVSPDSKHPFLCLTGSILNHKKPKATNYGTGIASSEDQLQPNSIGKILAARGLLSKRRAEEFGCKVHSVGEVTLLLPEYVEAPIIKAWGVRYFPHYVDYVASYELDQHPFNLLDYTRIVLDDIITSQKVVTSSLHVMLTCLAYKIPFAWVKWTDDIGGDGFKYQDFWSITNMNVAKPQDGSLPVGELEFYEPELIIDLAEFKAKMPKI